MRIRSYLCLFVAVLGVAIMFRTGRAHADCSCRDLSGQAGRFEGTIGSGGLEREYILYVHPRYKSNRPTPLVFLFHGFGQTPENILWYTNMEAFADAFKFILVAPKGIGLSWNDDSGFTPASAMGVDDISFVADMIDEIASDYCVHPQRIFATGLSNGATFSHRLACELAGLIAAIGPVAGTDPSIVLDYVSCSPLRPVPVIAFNGTADPFIPWNGGPGFWTMYDSSVLYPTVPTVLDDLAYRNGCAGETKVVYQEGDVTCIAFRGCAANSTVELCSIEGGGHNWPGAIDLYSIDPITYWWAGHTTEDIDASRAIWKFFAKHTVSQIME